MGKSSHWIRSIVSVFFIAIVLFIVIYLFAPELSLKFFGIAFGEEEKVSTALEDLIVENFDVDSATVEAYLDSDKGKEIVESVSSGLKKGARSISEAVSSEELQAIVDNVKSKTSAVKEDSL